MPDGSQQIAWNIPSGVAMGDSIKFTFMYNETSQSNKCTSFPPRMSVVNTYTSASLFCASTNSFCTNVKVSNGADSVNLVDNKPSLSANASAVYDYYFCGSPLGACNHPDSLKVTGSITDNGAAIPAGTPLYMEVFMDVDQSGTVTAQDTVLKTFTWLNGIPAGGSIPISFIDTVTRDCVACENKPVLIRFSDHPSGVGLSQCLCDSVSVQMIPTSSALLPLRLIFFTGTRIGRSGKLVWETEDDAGIESYILERSTDGITYAPLNTVPSGHNTGMGTYTSYDNNPYPGINYYRLRSVGIDLKVYYSNIIKLNFGEIGQTIKVYPSPVESRITINFSEPVAKEVMANVYTMAGQLVLSKLIAARVTTSLLDVSKLPSGEYILELLNDSMNEHIKFIKK